MPRLPRRRVRHRISQPNEAALGGARMGLASNVDFVVAEGEPQLAAASAGPDQSAAHHGVNIEPQCALECAAAPAPMGYPGLRARGSPVEPASLARLGGFDSPL
jgi:hypothetical protein